MNTLTKKLPVLLLCLATALVSYVLLDDWNSRNSPLFKRFERQWHEDVQLLEKSGKLPASWRDVREVQIIPGSLETQNLLRRIKIPVRAQNDKGNSRMEVIAYAWTEAGKIGIFLQYNIEDIASRNTLWELNRTLILQYPKDTSPWKLWLEELRQ